MSTMDRTGGLRVWYALFAVAALAGCRQGLLPGGAGDGGGRGQTVTDEGGGEGEAGAPLVRECLVANAGGGATPAGEQFFPPEGAEVGAGEVAFLWSASDREDNNLEVTIVVSDQPDVFDNPIIIQEVCAGSQTGLGRANIQFPDTGTLFWGVSISDGRNTVLRPPDGVGVRFEVTEAVRGRAGLTETILLCPQELLPARAVTTFQWLLGPVDPIRTQVFVSRAGQGNPFNAPLRVFEVIPPTATSLTLSEAEALPVGEELSWGLRVETAQAVQFSFEGQLGASFVVAENVPPEGELLGPDDGAVLADGAETFTLSWQADPGNCEDDLTSTVFFELLGASGEPAGLFESPILLDVGVGSLEVNLAAALDELGLAGGVWAWGVLADDGTDQTRLPDGADPNRAHRTFVRDTAPAFVQAPAVARSACGLDAAAQNAIAFSYDDENGSETVDVTLSFASNEAAVFDGPTASLALPAADPGASPAEAVVFLASAGTAGCDQFANGLGFYGIELDDGVNDPVRLVVEYQGQPVGTGACCQDDGTCSEGPAEDCTGGNYRGDGTTCATVECRVPTGACCLADGGCSEGSADACAAGQYQGDGTACSAVECPEPVGACCLPQGDCSKGPEDACVDGQYQGDGTSCATVDCPLPTGACCLANGACTEGTAEECTNGSYQGDDTSCQTVSCFTSPPPPPPITDCNTNGVPDDEDIANETSLDCNTSGVPDECELTGNDCNLDQIPDECQLFQNDCNSDGVPNECEPDCNANSIPDPCDILSGFSEDVDGNGVPDACERLFVAGSASGNDNGTSWTDAFNDLQDALAAAAASGGAVRNIWVDQGTYRPDQGANQTAGDRSATFQLQNGVAIYGGFCGDETRLDQRFLGECTATLSGDLADNDFGTDGGDTSENSLHVVTADGTDATAVLDGFAITGGNADGALAPDSNGGGMFNDGGAPTIAGCTFLASTASAAGGGMYNTNASPRVINCTFRGNVATGPGGAGGGMYNTNASTSATVINCTFSGNSAGNQGGGIWNGFDGTSTVTNCILWGNTDGGGTDESAQIHLESGTAAVNYCDIQGLTGALGGVGNIGGDPLLVALHLSAGSPCIDAGDNDAVPAGITTDLDGGPRFRDDPDTIDTGNAGSGPPEIVDMGAFEF